MGQTDDEIDDELEGVKANRRGHIEFRVEMVYAMHPPKPRHLVGEKVREERDESAQQQRGGNGKPDRERNEM